jgi:hypothetical protein
MYLYFLDKRELFNLFFKPCICWSQWINVAILYTTKISVTLFNIVNVDCNFINMQHLINVLESYKYNKMSLLINGFYFTIFVKYILIITYRVTTRVFAAPAPAAAERCVARTPLTETWQVTWLCFEQSTAASSDHWFWLLLELGRFVASWWAVLGIGHCSLFIVMFSSTQYKK